MRRRRVGGHGRTLTFVGLVGVINAVQVFDPVYVLTQGGPVEATNVLSFHIQRTAFQYGLAGQASAMAFTLLLTLVLVTGTVWAADRWRPKAPFVPGGGTVAGRRWRPS